MKLFGLAITRPFSILLSLLCLLSQAEGLRSQTRSGVVRAGAGRASVEILDSDRGKDGLLGPVRRVRTEVARLDTGVTASAEGPRSLLEITVYDVGGKRIANRTHPVAVAGAGGGGETYEYDERGQLQATVVKDEAGAFLSRTVYSYEYDTAGNWVKMTASVAVSEAGAEMLEPVEVTYRVITYYSRGAGKAPANAVAAPASAGDSRAVNAEGAAEGLRPTTSPRSSKAASDRHDGADGTDGASVPSAPSVEVKAEPPAPMFDAGLINDKALSLPRPAYLVGSSAQPSPVVVKVEVVVDETGRVISARGTEGPRVLWWAAESAARQAGFFPFREGGRPVRARGLLEYTFPFEPR
ncbi:MAG TPA: hypothetical protein VF240_13040 [Pyrinomonadaceae bacterium]